MNQIAHAAFVAAFYGKHGVTPDDYKLTNDRKGNAWKEKMEVLDSLAQVPDAPPERGNSVRGAYPHREVDSCGYGNGSTVKREEPTLGDFGAIGADSIVACTRPFNHVFATEV